MRPHSFFVTFVALGALLFAGALGSCKVDGDDHAAVGKSLKGWELYSWPAPNGREWRFALLEGSNRVKSNAEIRTGTRPLRGVNALREQLDRLPKGEFVFWCAPRAPGQPATTNDYPLPPKPIVDSVMAHAEQLGLVLALP